MPSERARRLWASLHEVFRNEDAWPLIEEAFEEERAEAWQEASAEGDGWSGERVELIVPGKGLSYHFLIPKPLYEWLHEQDRERLRGRFPPCKGCGALEDAACTCGIDAWGI